MHLALEYWPNTALYLLSFIHSMKLLDMIMCGTIELLGEEQHQFSERPEGRNMVCLHRQFVEKGLEMPGNIAERRMNPMKACTIVQRDSLMKTMRWLEVPETDARLMEAMFGETAERVAVGERMSEEIPVNIGLRQQRAFSHLQISIVMTLKIGNMKVNPGEDYSL